METCQDMSIIRGSITVTVNNIKLSKGYSEYITQSSIYKSFPLAKRFWGSTGIKERLQFGCDSRLLQLMNDLSDGPNGQ